MSTSRASSSRHQKHGHAGHELIQAEKTALFHVCIDCEDQIFGIGICYKCKNCKGYVHKACLDSEPDSTKIHSFIPNFSLKFSDAKNLDTKVRCSACCNYIKGIMYTGSHSNKTYDFHPHCLDLPQNLIHPVNKNDVGLKLYGHFPNSIKCMFCNTNDEKGWSYCVIKNDTYKLGCHVRCMRDKIWKDWVRKRIPEKQASREEYFKELRTRDMKKFTDMARSLGLSAAELGVDLTTSAFVGAPFNTLLSIAISLLTEVATSRSKIK